MLQENLINWEIWAENWENQVSGKEFGIRKTCNSFVGEVTKSCRVVWIYTLIGKTGRGEF